MKIPLNLHQNEDAAYGVDHDRAIERDVAACKGNDWEAKARLIHAFMPLLTSLSKKRATDIAGTNRCIEAGKEGMVTAVRKYRPETGQKFQVFAVSYIEAAMDRVNKERSGFFARLFGR